LVKGKIQVNNDTSLNWFPAIVAANNGGFIVVWENASSGCMEILGQRYDSLGDTIGGNFKVAAGTEQYFPNIAAAENGKFVVVWQTGVTGPYVCTQRFDSLGTPVDTSLIVYKNPSQKNSDLYPVAACSPDGNKFIVGWTGYNNTGEYADFMGQVYDGVTGDKIGTNVIINEDSSVAWQQQTVRGGSNIACNNDNIFFAWQDNRRNLGWDIYGKITDWDLAGVQGEKDFSVNRISYALMQNAPNPASGQTTIKYQLAKSGRVSLKVYNTLGQVVKTLINEDKQPGYYSVKWDGKNDENQKTAAGIYFYRLQSGDFTSTKKMVILR
ncbi:MAG: T9SS type A sorting domain-containing protein, partial [bacterium]|nr:T9SS type A sorting domain-containing protein [bacterium]